MQYAHLSWSDTLDLRGLYTHKYYQSMRLQSERLDCAQCGLDGLAQQLEGSKRVSGMSIPGKVACAACVTSAQENDSLYKPQGG